LKKYRNAIWDSIEGLDSLDFIAIPREQNSNANELVVSPSTVQISHELIKDNISVEVIFGPLVPDNMEHWQIFYDDK
jgi:hypothetical protein